MWAVVDAHLFARRILAAVVAVAEARRCRFFDALHIVRARHDRLRTRAPSRFDVGPDEYWEGFDAFLRARDRALASEPPPPKGKARAVAPSASPEPRRKGERRIVVDGDVYYWRVPRRPNENQLDLATGVFALVRSATSKRPFVIDFARPHPAVVPDAAPITPGDVARAIRAVVAAGAIP